MTLANRWTNELNCKIRRKSKSNNFLLRGYFGDCESNRRSHLCDSMFFSDWPMRVSFIVTGYVVSSTTLTTRDARLIQQVLWAVLLQGCRQCDMIVEDTELKQNWPWEQSPIIDTALTGLGGGAVRRSPCRTILHNVLCCRELKILCDTGAFYTYGELSWAISDVIYH